MAGMTVRSTGSNGTTLNGIHTNGSMSAANDMRSILGGVVFSGVGNGQLAQIGNAINDRAISVNYRRSSLF